MATFPTDALCVGYDPELFVPVGDGPATRAQEARALAVCAACPVRAACLADTPAWDVWTVRGGLTPAQRLAQVAA